jgi:hypothetical protein
MIDTETLALDPRAVVLQIGAAAWMFEDGQKPDNESDDLTVVEDTAFRVFNESLNMAEQIKMDRSISADTMAFHLDLGGICLGKSAKCKTSLKETMAGFQQFFAGFDDFAILTRGIAFDIPKLESLFDEVGVSIPWKYNQVWDYRTIQNLLGDPKIERPSHYTNHDGYWDARFQLKQLIAIFGKMGTPEDAPTQVAAKLNLNPQKRMPL